MADKGRFPIQYTGAELFYFQHIILWGIDTEFGALLILYQIPLLFPSALNLTGTSSIPPISIDKGTIPALIREHAAGEHRAPAAGVHQVSRSQVINFLPGKM